MEKIILSDNLGPKKQMSTKLRLSFLQLVQNMGIHVYFSGRNIVKAVLPVSSAEASQQSRCKGP